MLFKKFTGALNCLIFYKSILSSLFLASAQNKNFAKENVHRIKEIQKANREKQRGSTPSEPVKAVYKPGKFDSVESKVALEIKVCRILLHGFMV